MSTPLWTSAQAARATGGTSSADWVASGVSIDSRTLEKGDLFVALNGDNRDGHAFLADAFSRGAAAALVSRAREGVGPVLETSDTLEGLRGLARAARDRVRGRIVAVTGSVGKTSTKEALRLVLGAQGTVHASAASYNNHWGVPLSLARMPAETAFGIFEIGMNHAGEIAPLSQLVRPHVAVITAVEAVHMEFFPSIAAIAEEKSNIFTGLVAGGTAVINRDNTYFPLLRRKAERSGAARVVSFGAHAECDARLIDLEPSAHGSAVTAMISGQPLRYRLGAPGRHLALNSLAVLAAAEALGGDIARAAEALESFKAGKGRGSRTILALASGTISLIDESYNANPASMRAALALLGDTKPADTGRRIAVLGDMLELGQEGETYHRALGAAVEAASIDLVFTAGPLMKTLHDALPAARRGKWCERSAELIDPLLGALRSEDVVMVKGSFGSKMGLIIEALKAHAQKS